MSEDNLHMEKQQLMHQYLSGNASDAEVHELEKWVLADPANKRRFMEEKKLWMLVGMNTQQEAAEQQERRKNSAWETISKSESFTSKADELAKNVKRESTSSGKVISMNERSGRRQWLSIAAILVLLSGLAFGSFLFLFPRNEMTAESGNQTRNLNLADGSKVTLNRASSLKFVKKTIKDRRMAILKGDAFFDVARDEEHLFVVSTNDLEVHVLGTSFYVDAREDQENMEVTVNSGEVEVRVREQRVNLLPGEKALFNKETRKLSKIKNDNPNYMAFKTKNLIFDQTPLEQVAFDLSRQFNVDFKWENEGLKNCMLSSTFKNKKLDAILAVLKSTLSVDFEKNQNVIRVSGTCAGQ